MKPIIFNTEEVKAILDGRQSLFYEVIKPQPNWTNCRFVDGRIEDYKGYSIGYVDIRERAKYKPGEILYVKERWAFITNEIGFYAYYKYVYYAGNNLSYVRPKWQSPVTMPKEAARIFLKVKDVQVKRVQDITELDVINLGFKGHFDIEKDTFYPDGYYFKNEWNAKHAKPKPIRYNGEIVSYASYPYGDVWETREYKGKPWQICANPWVLIYEFERVETNNG